MFVNRPSDRVRDAAKNHIDGQVAVVIPVSWGFGLSTAGVFAFVFLLILAGTLIGMLVSNLVLALIMSVPVITVLVQTRRGAMGQGMVATTSAEAMTVGGGNAGTDTDAERDDDGPTGPGRSAVVLKAKRFSIATPSGAVHRAYPAGTGLQLLEERRWWQGVKCKIGEDIYFVNPNFDDEVRRALDPVTT